VLQWQVTQRVTVISSDVRRVLELSRAATALLRDGVQIDSGAPQFTIADPDSIKLKLIEVATRNGLERATTIATGCNAVVGKLMSASQGVFQIVARDSTEVSDYGSYDTSSIDKTVKAVVTLDFALRRD
jgi:hypothetical protein